MATTKLSTDAEEFPKLYRGIVEDNKDPKKLGRCRVRVPSIHGSLDSSLCGATLRTNGGTL